MPNVQAGLERAQAGQDLAIFDVVATGSTDGVYTPHPCTSGLAWNVQGKAERTVVVFWRPHTVRFAPGGFSIEVFPRDRRPIAPAWAGRIQAAALQSTYGGAWQFDVLDL